MILHPLLLQLPAPGTAPTQREILVQQRLHMGSRLRGGFVAEGAGLEFGEDAQPVDGPLFELLEGDVGGGREGVEVQARGVCERCVLGGEELFLAMGDIFALALDAGEVLSDHGCCVPSPLL
jgi:hypothetical protein